MRPRVAVIGGGANVEHEVSLASAAAIAASLDPDAWDVVSLTIGRDGGWSVSGAPLSLSSAVALISTCVVVVPALHGPRGEDGTLAALCELAGVPYVGSGVTAGAVGMDKWVTKLVAEAVGISTAGGVLLSAVAATSYQWDHPVVVKPVRSGSSQGVALVERAADWPAALGAALAVDDRVLVEEVVRGREIDVAVLGRPGRDPVVAPMLEILGEGIFDLATKYGGAPPFRVPAPLSEVDRARLETAAVRMHRALGCVGVARIDFFLTDAGPVLNEVNTMPGFTPDSQVPKMFAASGTSYAELVALLVNDAIAPPVVAPA